MRGRFDARMGLRYALTSLLKLVILFIAVLSVCAYALAVRAEYKFFSYGDCMLIV